MAVKIRLRRVGAKKQPSYRVVVADSRSPRDGRFIDVIGFYNPRTKPTTITIDEEKARKWLGNGARPTESVASLLYRAGIVDMRSPRYRTSGTAVPAPAATATAAPAAEPVTTAPAPTPAAPEAAALAAEEAIPAAPAVEAFAAETAPAAPAVDAAAEETAPAAEAAAPAAETVAPEATDPDAAATTES